MRYLYRCTDPDCGHERELQQSIKDKPYTAVDCPLCHPLYPDNCPTCIAAGLKRVYEAPRVNFGYRPAVHDQNDQFKFKNL